LRLRSKLRNQTQDSTTVPQQYAELLKIVVHKIREYGKIDPIVGKAIRILR
jgi:hypothetical protein